MGYAKDCLYKCTLFLDSNAWNYSIDSENGTITIPNIKIDNSLDKVTIKYTLRESDFSTFCCLNGFVPYSRRDEMSKLLTRINQSILFGCFSMDYSDGSVFYYCAVDYEDSVASYAMIKNAFHFVLNAMIRWGETIEQVANDDFSAEIAFLNSSK